MVLQLLVDNRRLDIIRLWLDLCSLLSTAGQNSSCKALPAEVSSDAFGTAWGRTMGLMPEYV